VQRQLEGTSFYILKAPEDFRARFASARAPDDDSDEEEGQEKATPEGRLGRGESFPDERTEQRLDVAALIRAHPGNLRGELRFHEELFHRLKFSHIEGRSKIAFAQRILEVPAHLGCEADVAAARGSLLSLAFLISC
jgi:hypothetical protein